MGIRVTLAIVLFLLYSLLVNCFRHDLELGSVLDTNPDVVDRSVSLFSDFIDFRSPGFGITHDPQIIVTPEMAHSWHQGLVLAAIACLEPDQVIVEAEIPLLNDPPETFEGATPSHTDRSIGPLESDPEADPSVMKIIIHTADANGADHKLSHTAAGYHTQLGDQEAYEWTDWPNNVGFERGYDLGLKRVGFLQALHIVENGGSEPTSIDSRVYHYRQTPMSSVVIRSRTPIGPRTVHKVDPIDFSVLRTPIISVMTVRAQWL